MPPPGRIATIVVLSATARSTTASDSASSEKLSTGVSPETTPSPSPRVALMSSRSGAPLMGSRVNSTPAASAASCRCTNTAIRAAEWATPCRSRYAIACGE